MGRVMYYTSLRLYLGLSPFLSHECQTKLKLCKFHDRLLRSRSVEATPTVIERDVVDSTETMYQIFINTCR